MVIPVSQVAAQDRHVLAAGVHDHLDRGVGQHARERAGVELVGDRVQHLGADAVLALVVGHRDLDQAQLRLVAPLGHELGVDRQPAVLGGAVGQLRRSRGLAAPLGSRRTRETIRSRRSTPRSSGPPISITLATWSLARFSSAWAVSSTAARVVSGGQDLVGLGDQAVGLVVDAVGAVERLGQGAVGGLGLLRAAPAARRGRRSRPAEGRAGSARRHRRRRYAERAPKTARSASALHRCPSGPQMSQKRALSMSRDTPERYRPRLP